MPCNRSRHDRQRVFRQGSVYTPETRLCFIKNVVKNPRIIIGDYTYYDDVDGADQFESEASFT